MPDNEALSLRDELEAAVNGGGDEPGILPAEPPVEGDPSEPQPSADGRVRDPQTGKFVAKTDAPVEQKPPQQARTAVQPKDQAQAPSVAQTEPAASEKGKEGSPPPGWSVAAKAAWFDKKIPPEVMADIARREEQVNQGFAKYSGLDQYVEMARNANTSLPEALQNYVRAEQLLERDPVQGLLWLCQNYNVDPQWLVQGGQGQSQPQADQPQFQQLQPVIEELGRLRQIVYGDKQSQIERQVTDFFAKPENRYAENVADRMVSLINSGQANDLNSAYEQACWLDPQIRDLQINERQRVVSADQAAKAKAAASQARASAKSINGGPAPGQTVISGSPPPDDLRQQLEQAFAEARA